MSCAPPHHETAILRPDHAAVDNGPTLQRIVYVLGTTNAGKSTLLDYAKQCGMATVEVGKEMRRRYPPGYFKGRGAMASTENEAMGIYREQLRAGEDSGAPMIFVDGQPRLQSQLEIILGDTVRRHRQHFILLWAPPEVLLERARKRDADEDAYALSVQRVTNDAFVLYGIVAQLLDRGVALTVYDTSRSGYNLEEVLRDCMASRSDGVKK